MNKVGMVALIGLIALGLAGCGDDDATATAARGIADAGQSVETPAADAPLVAETADAGTPALDSPEAAYIADVRSNLRAETVIPDATDQQLLTAADAACTQLRDGVYITEVSVIENEPADDTGCLHDSLLIAAAGQQYLCPDTIKQ